MKNLGNASSYMKSLQPIRFGDKGAVCSCGSGSREIHHKAQEWCEQHHLSSVMGNMWLDPYWLSFREPTQGRAQLQGDGGTAIKFSALVFAGIINLLQEMFSAQLSDIISSPLFSAG